MTIFAVALGAGQITGWLAAVTMVVPVLAGLLAWYPDMPDLTHLIWDEFW